jgi:hypothetical protein
MRRSDNRAALTDEVARFQDDVRELAFAIVRAIVQQELDRKRAQLPPAQLGAGMPGGTDTTAVPVTAKKRKQPTARTHEQLVMETMLEQPTAARAVEQSAATEQPAAATSAQPAASPATGRKRVAWTRESIISELASWMLSGTAIDASFVARYGPRGLVAATRRVFGRFEAALNVAGLHVSKLYPDGPPDRPGQTGIGPTRPA